jgi:hypothetical protein
MHSFILSWKTGSLWHSKWQGGGGKGDGRWQEGDGLSGTMQPKWAANLIGFGK